MGWIPSNKNKKRKIVLVKFKEFLEGFCVELKERRITLTEFAEKNVQYGVSLNEILNNNDLLNEDRILINGVFEDIKTASYKQSIAICNDLLNKLEAIIIKLDDYAKKTGKALPMVAGTIGLLLAVLLI